MRRSVMLMLGWAALLLMQVSAGAAFADPMLPPQLAVARKGASSYLVDAQGRTLYVNRDDRPGADSICFLECATTWQPVAAAPDAQPIGDFTLAKGDANATSPQRRARGKSVPQWQYRGKRLYTFMGDSRPGAIRGDGAERGIWSVAEYFSPPPALAAPPGVVAAWTSWSAGGYVLTNQAGHVLFTLPRGCESDCADWKELTAGMIARDMGDWSVARDGDRARWLFRGQPVLAFGGAADPMTAIAAGKARGAVPLRPAADSRKHRIVPVSRDVQPAVSAPVQGEMGFVFTQFHPAIDAGADHCPDGWALTAQDNYLATLEPAERERLSRAESKLELYQRWFPSYVTRADGSNMMDSPELFADRPPQRTARGKSADGFNLDGTADGRATRHTCPHEKFSGPDGEHVDSQFFRAVGCMRLYRGLSGSNPKDILNTSLLSGEKTVVLTLRGVDSLENDPEVEVVLASSKSKPALGGGGKIVAGSSLTIADNPAWRNVLRGRIDHGVLRTRASDIRLSQEWAVGGTTGSNMEWEFARGQLRLAFRPDGSVSGVLGGYQPLMSDLRWVKFFGGLNIVGALWLDAGSWYATLLQMADGDPDPRTGRCRSISSTYVVEAIPAFVFDRPGRVARGSR